MEEKNAQDILNAKTGNQEVPKNTVKPAKVKIVSVVVKDKNKDDKKMDKIGRASCRERV